MNIPSNYTIEEVIKYYPSAVPAELIDKLYVFLEEQEMLREQLYFRDEFIRSTVIRCKTATKCKELIQSILLELEESYIEL